MGQRLRCLSRVLGLLRFSCGSECRSPRMEENPHDFSPGQWHLDCPVGVVPGMALILFVFLQPMLAVCFFPAGWVAIGLIGSAAIQNVSVSLIVSVAFVLGAELFQPGLISRRAGSFSLGFVLLGA